MNKIILAVADWNYQDKYYKAPAELVHELLRRVLKRGKQEAWDWWVNQVDYGHPTDKDKPIKFLREINTSDVGGDIFWDYNDPLASAEEAQAVFASLSPQ